MISAKSDYCGGCRVRLLPSIRYGTEGYPETIARRLRALNITTWIAALLGAGFAITQLLNPAPGMWKPGIVNALAALIFATIPLLHRFGPLAAPLAFSVAGYAAIFLDCFFLGSALNSSRGLSSSSLCLRLRVEVSTGISFSLCPRRLDQRHGRVHIVFQKASLSRE